MLPSNLGGITLDTGRGIPIFNGSLRFYYNPDWYSDNSIVPPVSAYPEAWALKNKEANKLYYDPEVTYLPWAGTDAAGNPLFTDANPTAVYFNPNSPAGQKTDLTITYAYDDGSQIGQLYLPTYYEWVGLTWTVTESLTLPSTRVIQLKS